jgi:hypothetical protein
MIDGGGLSLFGFDLFGPGRRAKAAEAEKSSERKVPDEAKQREADRLFDREHSESFFWGMYPVY